MDLDSVKRWRASLDKMSGPDLDAQETAIFANNITCIDWLIAELEKAERDRDTARNTVFCLTGKTVDAWDVILRENKRLESELDNARMDRDHKHGLAIVKGREVDDLKKWLEEARGEIKLLENAMADEGFEIIDGVLCVKKETGGE